MPQGGGQHHGCPEQHDLSGGQAGWEGVLLEGNRDGARHTSESGLAGTARRGPRGFHASPCASSVCANHDLVGGISRDPRDTHEMP